MRFFRLLRVLLPVVAGWPGLVSAAAHAALPPDSLLAVVRTTRSEPQRVLALLKLSESYRSSDSTRAYRYATQAVAVAHRHVDTLEARSLLTLGLACKAQGHYQNALVYFQQALARSQRLGRSPDVAQSYREISNAQFIQSHFTEALAALRQELSLRRELHDTLKLVAVFNNMGSIARGQEDYLAALGFYLQAVKAAKQFGKQTEPVVAVATHNISLLYQEQDDYPRALLYMRRAATLHRALHDTISLAADFAALGQIYILTDNCASAQKCLEKSLHLGKALGKRNDAMNQAIAYTGLGRLQAEEGQHQAALRNFRQAERTLRRLSAPYNLITLLSLMADSYQATGQTRAARRTAQQVLALAQQTDSDKNLMDAYWTLSRVSAANRDFAAAYAYRLQYEAAYDSLFNAQKAQQLAALQTRYDLRNKEAQIALLRRNAALLRSEARQRQWLGAALGAAALLASLLGVSWYRRYRSQRAANRGLQAQELRIAAQNEDLRGTQQRLRQLLGEKEVLLKEVHHRVKNNLQIVASLFALQVFEQPGNPALAEALQEGQNRIQAIALIHELLYQSDDLARLDVHQFLQQLAAYLAQAFELPARPRAAPAGVFRPHLAAAPAPEPAAVTVDAQAVGVQLNASTAVPLGLMVNELLSNAYQHAFPAGRPGHVHLRIAAADPAGTYTLTLADDGVGLPPRFALATASSLGLRLVGNLARQLGGTFYLENGAVGTRVRITFREAAEGPAAP